jgi:hypothetical protein
MIRIAHGRGLAMTRKFHLGTMLAAVMMMFAAAFVASWSSSPAAAQGTAPSAPQSVQLVVDYGDGVSKTIGNLPWSKGKTVLDAMQAAAGRAHGISFGYSGAGDTAIMTKIDDQPDEGGGATKKNWQYWVNQTYGNRSFAAFELQAGDVVLWRFTTAQGQ